MKELQTFEYSLHQSWLEVQGADDQTSNPPQKMETRKGSIIFFLASNNEMGDYVVVPGWLMSKPRKASGRSRILAKVLPLTSTEKKKYRNKLRKTTCRTKILFW